jgi:hypothetical protein
MWLQETLPSSRKVYSGIDFLSPMERLMAEPPRRFDHFSTELFLGFQINRQYSQDVKPGYVYLATS